MALQSGDQIVGPTQSSHQIMSLIVRQISAHGGMLQGHNLISPMRVGLSGTTDHRGRHLRE